jgi:hypothetical protein
VGGTTAGFATMTPIKHMASQYLYPVRDCRTCVLVLIFASASSSPNAKQARPSWRAPAGRLVRLRRTSWLSGGPCAWVDGAIRWKAQRNRLFPKVQAKLVLSK